MHHLCGHSRWREKSALTESSAWRSGKPLGTVTAWRRCTGFFSRSIFSCSKWAGRWRTQGQCLVQGGARRGCFSAVVCGGSVSRAGSCFSCALDAKPKAGSGCLQQRGSPSERGVRRQSWHARRCRGHSFYWCFASPGNNLSQFRPRGLRQEPSLSFEQHPRTGLLGGGDPSM